MVQVENLHVGMGNKTRCGAAIEGQKKNRGKKIYERFQFREKWILMRFMLRPLNFGASENGTDSEISSVAHRNNWNANRTILTMPIGAMIVWKYK